MQREMIKIQVNGIGRLGDIQWLNEEKPDYAGFVFYQNHNRVTLEQERYLHHMIDPSIQTIGIFMYASLWLVADLLESKVIDGAQLNGKMTVDEILQLRRMTDKPLIKKIPLEKIEDIEEAQKYPVDYILYDCKKYIGKDDTYLKMLLEYGPQEREFFISDRLCEGCNMDEIRQLNLKGIVLDTLVEAKGQRDIRKVKDMIKKIRE